MTLHTPISDLTHLLQSIEPVRNPGVYIFVSVPGAEALESVAVVATVREPEGLSAIITEPDAVALGLPIRFRAAWITLTVQSDLEAIGFTAAFASALGENGISCNVVAGAWHDHLFVPVERAEEALAILGRLQAG